MVHLKKDQDVVNERNLVYGIGVIACVIVYVS